MATEISPQASVHPDAELGADVTIGPFCVVGPHVCIGEDTVLHSHVVVEGDTTLGKRNQLFPLAVLGTAPQDSSYQGSRTRLEVGDDNVIREGVTVNRGAEKEDGVTCLGDRNLLMANCHVAHNCKLSNEVILANGVLLGGHVHVHDRVIVSGNSVVHHFATLGTLCFIGGGFRVPQDVPPYMVLTGSDNPTIRSVNSIGMSRQGIPPSTIKLLKQAHRLLFREHKPLHVARARLEDEVDGPTPPELTKLWDFIARQQAGKLGRARETVRHSSPPDEASGRKAA